MGKVFKAGTESWFHHQLVRGMVFHRTKGKSYPLGGHRSFEAGWVLLLRHVGVSDVRVCPQLASRLTKQLEYYYYCFGSQRQA